MKKKSAVQEAAFEVSYQSFTVLKGLEILQKEGRGEEIESALLTIWNAFEDDFRKKGLAEVCNTIPAVLTLSYYFHFHGDFTKAVNRFIYIMKTKGAYDEKKVAAAEVEASLVMTALTSSRSKHEVK